MGTSGGVRRKSITVVSNDPVNSTVRLTVQADVTQILGLDPARLNVRQIRHGTASEHYVRLTGTAADTARITNVTSRDPNIEVTFSREGFAGHPDAQLRVRIGPQMKIGRFRQRIALTTDHDTVRHVTLYVYGEVTGNILVSPAYLSLGILRPGQALERAIVLKAAGEQPFQITSVSASVADVEVRT